MMNVDLQQLRYVVALDEERHFTRAARREFVVQSALSHQLAKLEQEIGVRLFDRSSRGVAPTAAGQALLPWARACLEAAERAAAAAAAVHGVVRGTLQIGVIPTLTQLDLPTLLRRLRERHPEVTTRVRVGSSDTMIEQVRDGVLDLAVLGLADSVTPTGVSYHELAHERLLAVLAADHPLADRTDLRLADLADQPFADFAAGSTGRTQSDLAFERAGLGRQVVYEAGSPELITALVAEGLVVAMLPPGLPLPPRVRTVPVTDGPARTAYLVWHRTRRSPATLAALDLLEIPAG